MPVERTRLLENAGTGVPGIKQHVLWVEFEHVMRKLEQLQCQIELADALRDVNAKSDWNGTFSIRPAQQYDVQAKQITVAFGVS